MVGGPARLACPPYRTTAHSHELVRAGHHMTPLPVPGRRWPTTVGTPYPLLRQILQKWMGSMWAAPTRPWHLLITTPHDAYPSWSVCLDRSAMLLI